MTKAAPMAAGAARVLGQAATGAAFAIFFGLAGAATANAREVKAQQPPHRCAGDCSGNGSGGNKISRSLGELKNETAKALEKFANEKPQNKPEKPQKNDKNKGKGKEKDKDENKSKGKGKDEDKDEGKGKDKDEDKPEKDRGERSGGDRRHDDDDDDDDDGGKSEKDRNGNKPEKNRDDDDDDKPEKGKDDEKNKPAKAVTARRPSETTPARRTTKATDTPVSLMSDGRDLDDLLADAAASLGNSLAHNPAAATALGVGGGMMSAGGAAMAAGGGISLTGPGVVVGAPMAVGGAGVALGGAAIAGLGGLQIVADALGQYRVVTPEAPTAIPVPAPFVDPVPVAPVLPDAITPAPPTAAPPLAPDPNPPGRPIPPVLPGLPGTESPDRTTAPRTPDSPSSPERPGDPDQPGTQDQPETPEIPERPSEDPQGPSQTLQPGERTPDSPPLDTREGPERPGGPEPVGLPEEPPTPRKPDTSSEPATPTDAPRVSPSQDGAGTATSAAAEGGEKAARAASDAGSSKTGSPKGAGGSDLPKRIYQGNGIWYHPRTGTFHDHAGNDLGIGPDMRRDAQGKFVSRNGGSVNGSEAEEAVWRKLEGLGMTVIRGRITVRAEGFPDRVYDGAIDMGDGTLVAIEVKSGGAKRTKSQREFDSWLNKSAIGNYAQGVGRVSDYKVIGVYYIKR